VAVPCIAFAFYLGSLSSDLKHVGSDIQQAKGDIKRLEDRLDNLQINGLKSRVSATPATVINELASSENKLLQKALPVLHEAIDSALISNVALDPVSTKKLTRNLLNVDARSRGYWPTVLRFIAVTSALQNQTDVPPPGPPRITLSENHGFGGVILGPIDHSIVLVDGGDVGPLDIRNSRVILTNNPVQFRDVKFSNCVFELPEIETPIPQLQNAVRQLLTSNLTGVSGP
jgi:hypothetical protein